MESSLKILIWILIALKVIPFILTQLLFCSCGFENEKRRLRRVWIPGTLLNLIGNGAAAWVVTGLLLREKNPWPTLLKLTQLQGSWQSVNQLAVSLLICLGVGLAGGGILRLLFFHNMGTGISRGRKATATVITLVCMLPAVLGAWLSFRSTQELYLSEVCRKTEKVQLTGDEQKQLSPDTADVCYATVTNPGLLECDITELWLSESMDEPERYVFRKIVIPAGGSFRLAMDEDHGLDLEEDRTTEVFLSDSAGHLIDRVEVPPLREFESYFRSGEKTDTWEIRYLGKHMLTEGEEPVFSVQSGFFPEAFDLTISAADGLKVYYSLDGSDPTVSGTLYTGPLRVEDRSGSENVWSTREDVNASFPYGSTRFTVPEEPVDKCTIVRAVAMDDQGRRSKTVTESYFVGFDQKTGYSGLRIAALTCEPDSLFGDEGIYVLGRTYREKHTPETDAKKYWLWPANYRERGGEWEREASVQLFDINRELILNKDVGVRIKGGASAGLLPKGLNLYARSIYDETSRFFADLFGTGYQAKRISLSGGGNDVDLKVKDWLTAQLASDLNLTMSGNIPYCLFLNGEYWGNYWMMEQMDEYYLGDRYGLVPTNVVIIKNGKLKSGMQDDLSDYNKLVKKFKNTDLSDAKKYKNIGKEVDLENFITYYAVQMFVGNHDRTMHNNVLLWKTRNQENGETGDSRWRWGLFDLNHTSCYAKGEADTLAYLKEKDTIFASLMNSTEFCDGFYAMLRKLAEEVFTAERAEALLEEYTALLWEPMVKEHLRFSRNMITTAQKEMEEIRTFFRERKEYILALCDEYEFSRGSKTNGKKD